jgi:hypothetical protein
MLDYLSGQAGPRKHRLFACACCRHLWHLLKDDRSREAIGAAERYADQLASQQEMRERWSAAHAAARSSAKIDKHLRWPAARAAALTAIWSDDREAVVQTVREVARSTGSAVVTAGHRAEQEYHRILLRDIFGNPFRQAVADPAWLTWHGGTIPELARAAYDARDLPGGALDPVRLAVLADALEAAGCGDADLSTHLRGPGPHVRGCWAVDLLLGKA